VKERTATSVPAATLLIDGEWLETEDKIAVRNPFNNDLVGYASRATREQTLAAAQHAKAYEPDLTAYDRYEVLNTTPPPRSSATKRNSSLRSLPNAAPV
jgi:hypothetical protein